MRLEKLAGKLVRCQWAYQVLARCHTIELEATQSVCRFARHSGIVNNVVAVEWRDRDRDKRGRTGITHLLLDVAFDQGAFDNEAVFFLVDEPLALAEDDFVEGLFDLVKGQTAISAFFLLVVEVGRIAGGRNLVERGFSVLIGLDDLLETVWRLLLQLNWNAGRSTSEGPIGEPELDRHCHAIALEQEGEVFTGGETILSADFDFSWLKESRGWSVDLETELTDVLDEGEAVAVWSAGKRADNFL